jgi:hypothetical protein
MIQPWEIVAVYPDCTTKQFGSYSTRGEAENDAQQYRRLLSRSQIHVHVLPVFPPTG